METRPWVRHYDPGVEASIDIPDITLPQLFHRTAQRYPRRVATIFHTARLHYEQLEGQIDAFSGGLRAIGVRPGERVAVMLPNIPQFIVAFFGALQSGAVVVPTNPLYTQLELEHQLADAGATVIVTLDQFFPRVQAALTNTSVRTVVVASIAPALPRHLQPLYSLKQWREGVHAVRRAGVVHRFGDLLDTAPVSESPCLADDLAVLQYTGGTTGRAKGAMLTHRNLIANTLMAYSWQGHSDHDQPRILCATPFFHVYGLTIGMNLGVASGATMILVARFIPREVAQIAQKHRPHLFPGVPTMYVALADLPGFSATRWGSLEVCISGAAPLPSDVQNRFQEVSNVRLVEGYGLTEASPVTHCNPVHGESRPGTIGVPFPNTDARITDSDSWEELPLGTVGELTVRGPQVMQGYFNRPEETAEVLRDGWLHTGDLATMDEDGYFTIVDRKKDMIIAGGYKVYPREVEDVLARHPKVKEAAVIGVSSHYRGETVKAFVVLLPGTTASEEEILAFCGQELAVYKTPKTLEFRSELPKTLIGKILRRELREPLTTDSNVAS